MNNIEDAVAVKEINLVADSIRLGGAILKYYPEMLAAQVILWSVELEMKVAEEKALVGAFFVIVKLRVIFGNIRFKLC